VGDEVLKVFAERIKDNLRSFDLVARLGGEEFVAILPDVSPERAYVVAERLRRSIADVPIPCSVEGGALNVTTSIGGAIINRGGHSIPAVLERADKCLYEAKNMGRNCAVFENKGKLNPEDYKEVERSFID
jgi:two-component system cell cycle response regulator